MPDRVSPVQAFSARLNALLDARGFAAKGSGRQSRLADLYGLTQKATRKWVEGEGMPEISRLLQVAADFNCNLEWLALGRGPRDAPIASAEQVLAQRLAQADPETKKLVELALNEDDPAAAEALSPSLLAMVRMLKQAIKAERPH